MIVVAIIAVIASIAIPSLLEARKAANEAAAIASLRLISSVQLQYATRNGRYANLAQLCDAGFIDSVFGTATKQNYCYITGFLTATSYCVKAEPINPNSGGRSFRTQTDGVIYELFGGTIGWTQGTAIGK